MKVMQCTGLKLDLLGRFVVSKRKYINCKRKKNITVDPHKPFYHLPFNLFLIEDLCRKWSGKPPHRLQKKHHHKKEKKKKYQNAQNAQ